MNVENIKKVRDVIAGLTPERFDMGHWSACIKTGNHVPPSQLTHTCGTCGCIGGWTNAIFEIDHESERKAAAHLGLSLDEGDRLFYPPVATAAWSATPTQAVAVLDHLLATGEVDWTIAAQVQS